MVDWFEPRRDMAVVITWADGKAPGGQQVRCLGTPQTQLWDYYGIYLTRREGIIDERDA
jgi:hypothetical protein